MLEFANQQTPGIAAPTSALVTAQLEAGVIDGRRKAEEVALKAGFLGGDGKIAILGHVIIGITFVPAIFSFDLRAMTHGTVLEGAMGFFHGFIFHQPLVLLIFARAFCLASGRAREAHRVGVLICGWGGTVGLADFTLRTELYAKYGCSW